MPKSNAKEAAKAKWYAAFEKALTALRPELTGKIDWDTATYLMNTKNTPEEAASRMAKSSKE